MTLVLAIFVSMLAVPGVSAGDSAYVHMHYGRADSLYSAALADEPNNPEVLWRLARLYISIADVSPRENKEALYRKADTLAQACVAMDDKSSQGHTWLAAALGNIAMFEGGRTKVRLANEIQDEVNRAIQLDSLNDVAWSILGSFYRALGNVSWLEKQLANLLLGGLPDGGFPEAESALKKAIVIAPQSIRHRYELGMLYIDWDREIEGKAELARASQLPVAVRSDSTRLREIKEVLAASPK